MDPVDALERLEAAVHEGRLEGVVDQVARRTGPDTYRLTGSGGTRAWARGGPGTVEGTDPVARQDPAHLLTAAEQRARPHPDPADNSFPYAQDNVEQLFDAAHAPDAVVLAHPGQRLDGVVGHHGGLGVVQARAPFIAAGAGVVRHGVVDDHLRMVDVAPTLVALAGGAPLAAADGRRRTDLVGGEAEHVLVFLLDGTNAAALAEAMADGHAPTIAGLAADGTTYGHGVLAALPTATLANHTTALTGAAPGHSGVLHHTWHDRGRGATPDLLAIPAMFGSRDHLDPAVTTVHEAVKAARPDAVSVCTYEYVDRGADWSTFALLHRGEHLPFPDDDTVAAETSPLLLEHEDTAFMSRVDAASTAQAVDRWSGVDHDLPAFCWVNLNVTDVAGHAEGPHGDRARAAIVDSDRRVARVLDAVAAAGALDRTAVVVMADHGMQRSAPAPAQGLGDLLAADDGWLVVDHALAYGMVEGPGRPSA